ncbi:MAG: hypothetical protein OES57_19350, partial [Acidimicrobiia bacterium]|nr:hypothetical protein [Acidimicrobiia bacterium]
EAVDEGVDEFEELTEESAGDAADEIALGVEDDDAGEVEAQAVVDDHDDAPGDEVDEAVDALFAKVRAAAEPETDDASAAVATLTRERVTVLDDDPIAGRDRVTESIEQAVARALKRSLADDQNELLDAARQTRSFASVADLIDEAAHRERYVEPVRADLVEAFHAGATAGGDPAVDTDLAGAEAALETELVARLRRDLDDVIGTGPDDFDDRLRLLARDLRRNRLSETASFAVLTAYNRGFELALARSPRRWMRDDRHECGLDCEANARAGVVPADHRFDGDVTHPPMFPGCRCQLAGAEQ